MDEMPGDKGRADNFESARQKIDQRDVRNRVRSETADAQPDCDYFAELRRRHRLVRFVEKLAINLQSIGDSLVGDLAIEPSFDDLVKCAERIHRRIAAESKPGGVARKVRALQQLLPAGQALFFLGLVDLGDRQLRRILRDDLRIRFQRQDGVGGRERIEATFADRARRMF